jgi:transposase
MAMTIVENNTRTVNVTGGVDTHAEFHVVAAVDANGGLLGVETFETTTGGHRGLVRWLESFGVVDKIGVEGTGSCGTGLARHLTGKGITVIEVDRPNRQAHHRAGKSVAIDAIAAARAVLTGTATGQPKSRDGNIEAIRVLSVARRSGANEWIQILNQMRHLCCTRIVEPAPDPIRSGLGSSLWGRADHRIVRQDPTPPPEPGREPPSQLGDLPDLVDPHGS